MTDQPRAKTADEVREEFMRHLAGIAHYWATLPDKTPIEQCNGVVFSILNIFDGTAVGLPAMDISLSPHPDDQEYHRSDGSNWYEPQQVINGGLALHEQWCDYERTI